MSTDCQDSAIQDAKNVWDEDMNTYVKAIPYNTFSSTLPVDFAAVLAVGSALVGWTPRELNTELVRVERRMIAVERFLDSEAQTGLVTIAMCPCSK